MSAVALRVRAASAVVTRDFLLFASYRFTFVSQLLATLFTLTMFFYVSRLVSVGDFSSSDDYYAFVVIGILTLEIVHSTLVFLPTALRQELVAGTFERLVISPFGAVGSVCAMAVFPLLWALVKATVMLGVAVAVFGLPFEGAEAMLAIPVGALAALAFAPFGLLIAALVLVVKQAFGAANWIVAGITIVAGFYFPVMLLPG